MKSKTEEKELLSKLKAGDAKAVEQWFAFYNKKLLRLVLSKVSNLKDADEIVQDTFLNCLKHLPVFRGDSSIWTWMCRITYHEIADYYRKKYAKKVIRTLPIGDMILAAPISDSHETSEKMRLVFGKMNNSAVELLKMKYIDKKKVKEIALELNKSAKAVESDLFRARIIFRRLWVKIGN
ncbi:MAG: RNA polymerase sigma factor [Patescibacteria group bacterium]